jgi:predicted permease
MTAMRAEHWWYTLPLRLKSVFRRDRVEQELDEEMQFHLDRLIEEGIASGLPPREARAAALRAMGGIEQHKERARDMRPTRWLTDFLDDVRYAARSLRRAPGLAVFVVLTLALGIGLAAGPLSMLDALVFRPYPVPDPGNVLTLSGVSRASAFEPFSYREYLDLRDHTNSYQGVVANGDFVPVGFSLDPKATPRVKGGMLVSGNYFSALRVEPKLGRGFRLDEDQVPGRDAVVVLGHDFWRHECAGDPAIVGRTMRLNGRDFTIIGVALESFPGMQVWARPDFFVPFAMARVFSTGADKDFFEDRDDRELIVRARLKPGVGLQQARNELTALAQDLEREYPKANHDRGAIARTQFQLRTRSDDANWKFGAVFVTFALGVLLVACTNVAGLLLSRGRTRTREIAVRLALGAGRSRLVRMLLAESLLLACLGGLAGVGVGYLVIHYLRAFALPTTLPVTVPFRMDHRILLASVVLTILSAIACGLAPALQSTRTDLIEGLKSAEIEAPGRKRLLGRNVLVVAQVSLSLMLLTASLLVLRGFQHVTQEGMEFAKTAKDHVLLASFDPRLLQYDAGQTARFYQQLLERARQTPGVASAGLTQNPPLGLEGFEALSFVPEGAQQPADRDAFTSAMDTIDEGFFDSMAIPIVAGRAFLASDTKDTPRVAIVNEHFASHWWPGGNAVGKRIRIGGREGEPVEVVGVARTIQYRDGSQAPMDFVYLPVSQRPVARMTLLLRASGEPLALVPVLKELVRALDPNMPLIDTRSYMAIYRYAAVEGPGIAIRMVGFMGLMALVLALVGIYGLVAYNVTRRTHEIGIRMAIGADRADVLRMVLGKGLVVVAVGLSIGLVLGFAVERLMNSTLFHAGGIDVLVYLVVVPSTFAMTTLAAYIPALRASRIEPTRALRYE